MFSPPCSITVGEGYQICVSESDQPQLQITQIYTTNPGAFNLSLAELSVVTKAIMLQQQLHQQEQHQAKRKEGSTAIRRSCRQRKRPRYFPPIEVRMLAARRLRQMKTTCPFVCSLFTFFFTLTLTPLLPPHHLPNARI